jgi:hypothetical protein
VSPVRFVLLFAIGLALTTSRVSGGDKIWSAVIIASNAEKPKESPTPLRPVSERLKRLLGYSQLEILGSCTEEIDDCVEKWLLPTRQFSLKVKARRSNAVAARGGYLINLQLFQEKRQLVETEAMLAPDSPLFIRGPLHARGQILIVLQVKP